jgi:beta-phosphoglucomutase-like phosphatase (HAD superfamily)
VTEALLFDCDGVLADSEALNYRCWSETFAEILGAPLLGPPAEIVGLDLGRLLALGLAVAGRPHERPTPALRDAVLARKSELFLAYAPTHLRPVPGARSLLDQARARRLPRAIVSSALRPRLLRTLELLDFAAGWGAVLAGEDLLPGPVPRKDWQRAATELGIPLARCTVFEDSPEGIASAREQGAGLVLGLTTSLPAERLRSAGAHRVVSDLAGIDLSTLATLATLTEENNG